MIAEIAEGVAQIFKSLNDALDIIDGDRGIVLSVLNRTS